MESILDAVRARSRAICLLLTSRLKLVEVFGGMFLSKSTAAFFPSTFKIYMACGINEEISYVKKII